MRTSSIGTSGRSRGKPGDHRTVLQARGETVERRAHHLLQRVPSRPGCWSAPDSRRVISSRFCTRRFRRSASSWMVSSSSRRVGGSRRGSRFEQGARRARDGGERRAQVVRHRAQERVPQALGLRPHLRLLGLLGEDGPLQGQGGLAGEGLQLVELLGGLEGPGIRGPDPEHAQGAVGGDQGQVQGGGARAGWSCRGRPSGRARTPTGSPPAPWRPPRTRRRGRPRAGAARSRPGAAWPPASGTPRRCAGW